MHSELAPTNQDIRFQIGDKTIASFEARPSKYPFETIPSTLLPIRGRCGRVRIKSSTSYGWCRDMVPDSLAMFPGPIRDSGLVSERLHIHILSYCHFGKAQEGRLVYCDPTPLDQGIMFNNSRYSNFCKPVRIPLDYAILADII